jgi:hypothetical protein
MHDPSAAPPLYEDKQILTSSSCVSPEVPCGLILGYHSAHVAVAYTETMKLKNIRDHGLINYCSTEVLCTT